MRTYGKTWNYGMASLALKRRILLIRRELQFVALNLRLRSNMVENKVYNPFKTFLSKKLD